MNGRDRLADTRQAQTLRRGRVGIERDDARAGTNEIQVQVTNQLRLVQHHLRRPQRRRLTTATTHQFLAHAAVQQHDFSPVTCTLSCFQVSFHTTSRAF